jgi:hypothetical protein
MKDLICLFLYSIVIELALEGVKIYIQRKGIYLDKKKKLLINTGTIILTVVLFLGIVYLLEFLDPNLLNLVEI